MQKKRDLFPVINGILLVGLSVITVYPFIYVLSMSISSLDAVLANKVWLLPVGFSIRPYLMLFEYGDLWLAYGNSVWYAVVGVVGGLFITMLAAYPLALKRFCIRKALMVFIMVTMLFSGGMVPLFLVVKRLGLYNTRWAMVLPTLTSAWFILIASIYIRQTIDVSLFEAAKMDGYNDLYILFKIVYPMSTPILAYLALNAAVYYWNSYFNALLFLTKPNLQPVQIFLRRILILSSPEVAQQGGVGSYQEMFEYGLQLKYSSIVVAILPILLVYPFLQKYFVKGIMIGSVK